MPYKHILTSGAALLSVAFERPIIAPRSGLIPELIQGEKQGYLFDSYQQMLALMHNVVECQQSNPQAWEKKFDFSSLNSCLRWPILTSSPGFSKIFSASPRCEIFNKKRSRYKYAFLRILGNDLPLRHSQDQTYKNLEFQLDHEKDFEDCIKIWVLNRIVDSAKKQQLIDLLESHNKQYVDIPFDSNEFREIGYRFSDLPRDDWKLSPEFKKKVKRIQLVADTLILQDKNNYLINNNGARNRAFQEGAQHADWIFPWDGNCFLTEQAWSSITLGLQQRDDLQYHLVPMERLLNNHDMLDSSYIPNPNEEPQIIFRKDADFRFDENLMYGNQPKVELFKRLGVPGVWDNWKKLIPWGSEMVVKHSQVLLISGLDGHLIFLAIQGKNKMPMNAQICVDKEL